MGQCVIIIDLFSMELYTCEQEQMRNITKKKKCELVYYTFIRYRAMFIFVCHCTRLLLNEIHSVNVKYIIDYKVKFLIYTRTYSLNGRVRGGMLFVFFFQNSLHDLVSFLSLHILFRFVFQYAYFVSSRRVSFCCVSFLFRFSLYRDPN